MILNNSPLTVVRIPLQSIETALSDPKVTALTSQGYIVQSMLPVEDGDQHYIMLFLQRRNTLLQIESNIYIPLTIIPLLQVVDILVKLLIA